MELTESATEVRANLARAPEFDSACNAAYYNCLHLNPHMSGGIPPFELVTAAIQLHMNLTCLNPNPLILRWVPNIPDIEQVHAATQAVTGLHNPVAHDGLVLGPTQFRQWALVLFTNAVVGNSRRKGNSRMAILKKIPIWVAVIAAVGAVYLGFTG